MSHNGHIMEAAKARPLKPSAARQAAAYLEAVHVMLEQTQYLVQRIRKKVASADWDDAQSASRALTGYSTDLNRMVARVRGKGRA